MTKRKIEYWVIPPEQDGEFVACMEEVLETYAQAYDPRQPVLCMDEQPVQLLKETRMPIPATKEHGQRVDYEYERNGTASIFMFAEPLSGFRQATARARRTKEDWAIEVAELLDGRYADCAKVTLVCDNLNTHTKGAFYEAFEAERARGYVQRIDFCYTPKHGSWLNVAEMRVELPDQPVPSGPSHRRTQRSATRNRHLVRQNQRQAARRRLAVPHRKCPHETETPLPTNQDLMPH